MTLHQVQRCLFDHLRRLEDAGDGPRPEMVTDGYDLTEEEIRALREPDIGAIYRKGTHPVIITASAGRWGTSAPTTDRCCRSTPVPCRGR